MVVANLHNAPFFSELESASLPNPHSTASKKLRLLLDEGTIVLRPLQFGQVRGCEERSDELRRRVYGISALVANSSVRNVAAAKSTTISNTDNTTFHATRFARRRNWP